jgi:hypothetical protein
MYKNLPIILAFLAGCETTIAANAEGEFSRIDNQSNAKLVLVADANWSFDADLDWNVTCSESPVDVVVVVIDDGWMTVSSAASLLGADCTLSVRVDPVREIVVPGDGPIETDGPCDDLQVIDVTGNGSVSLGTVETDTLDVSITGNGNLTIADLQAKKLILHLTGDGDATLAGAVDEGEFTIGGSGLLDASELVIGDLDIALSGSGDAIVNVTGSITGEVSGSGNLNVLGAPGVLEVEVVGDATGVITYA